MDKEKKLLEEQAAKNQATASQSSTVQQAQSALDQASNNGYQSKWQTQINDALNQYMNRDKFNYDINADALYAQLKDQYALMGQQAMMDTMGQAQAMTGGYGNSYAQSVGQQAYQGYMQQLNDKIPDLYQLALNQYLNEGDQLLDNISLMMQQESVDYGQYRDLVGDQQWQESFDYNKSRDEIADQQWQQSFDYGKTQDNYNRLMQLMLNYHYEPTEEELAAAGMTKAQKNAVMKPYYDYLAALAAEEEDSGGGRSIAYIDPNDQPQDGGGGGETWITYDEVKTEADQMQHIGASRQDINNMINDRLSAPNYKPSASVEEDAASLKTIKVDGSAIEKKNKKQ